jgi:uncharacterized protein (DUF2384 family)
VTTNEPNQIARPPSTDLQRVTERARLIWGDAAAVIWLFSPNSYLAGARPIDALEITGPAPVSDALDAETCGGAA